MPKGWSAWRWTGLTSISGFLGQAKGLLVEIANNSNSQDQRDQYVTSYKNLVAEVANAVDGSTYNGQTLLGAASGAVSPTSLTVINNESGATSTLSGEDVSGVASTLAGLIGATYSRSSTGVDTFTPAAAGTDQTTAAAAVTSTTGPGPSRCCRRASATS